jgi:two-component system nitrogen regulation response regulator NtrX
MEHDMAPGSDTAETVLIVDDEEPVRKTFREWLEGANLGCNILTAGDAGGALALADRNRIDLAILDWHLGAGNDGLQLLEDLTVFSPDVVAIMVTGFAHQATPLMAMRMGVRDYLDKNHDLDRTTFLRAVRNQLERIRPARRERRINQGLATFRATVEQVLPLIQAAAALNDPVPLPEAIRSLFRFLQRVTGARSGVLLVHSFNPGRHPEEITHAYDDSGGVLDSPLVPFSRSLAGSAVSMQEPHAIDRLDLAAADGVIELQPFEREKRSVLAAPLSVAPGVQVVLELFDKKGSDGAPAAFNDGDRQLARSAAEFGTDLLRQALAERHTHRVLSDAVAAALRVGDEVAQSLRTGAEPGPKAPTPDDVLASLDAGLREGASGAIDASATLRLAEAIRVLALRYGPRAVEHCTRMVSDLRGLLDETTGTEGEART